MALSKREKYLVGAAAVVLILLGSYQFLLRRAIERTRDLRRLIPEKQEELAEIRQLAREYERIGENIEQLSAELPEPEAGFSPLSFIEKNLETAGIGAWSLSRSREVRGERVVQVSIDVRIEETGWRELVDFFRAFETEPSIRLSRIDIRRQRGRGELRANVTVTGLRAPD